MTDGRESIRTPSLETVLTMALDHASRELRVAMPGRVEAYDAATQKADVQPLIQDTFLDDDGGNVVESLPVVPDVPVVFPRAGGFYFTMPVAKGDHVLLIVNDRSIDKFTDGDGGETDPVDLRTHNLSDAVALIGFSPFANAIADPVEAHTLIGREGGSVIALKDDDQIHLGSIDASDFVALAAMVKAEIQGLQDAITGAVAVPQDGGAAIQTAVGLHVVGDVAASKVKAD